MPRASAGYRRSNHASFWGYGITSTSDSNWRKHRYPDYPLYFVKLGGALSAHRRRIQRPPGFTGRVKFEAELGIVIGRACYQIERSECDDVIFGYTCVNDVTAPDPLFANGEFHQWCRAKSFPGFGPIGPVVTTGIDPAGLRVRGILDGEIKQDYPVSDMIFSPQDIVWHLAREITAVPRRCDRLRHVGRRG